MKKSMNPVVFFEIPVTDMPRAMGFYTSVFGFVFEVEQIDDNSMAYFPFFHGSGGASGALAKGETYRPATTGTLVYFGVENIDHVLSLVEMKQGKVLFPKTSNDGTYFVAEIEDSEGNRIGLHMTV